MTEMVRVEEKEERRWRRKRSEGEGEDRRLFVHLLPVSSLRTCEKREESELSSQLPHDGSNFHREETQGEKERRDGEVCISVSRKI